MHCSGMLWHPDVATQLVLASEDDRLPVIQMWDLRFATSPLKVLENHTRWGFSSWPPAHLFFLSVVKYTVISPLLWLSSRGILSISWSQADSELLLSSAKDNRILCWNPNTGEVHDNNHVNSPEYTPYLGTKPWILTHVISCILGHLWASHNEPVVFWCPVVPKESSPAFSCLIWWEDYCVLCDGRELEGSAAKHSW